MGTFESQLPAVTVLDRIAKLSAHNPDKKFHSLMHHISVGSLRACFHELDGRRAVGIDGVTKADYGENLEANLEDLIAKMKRMAYRPGPVREVLIPKEGKQARHVHLALATLRINSCSGVCKSYLKRSTIPFS